METSTEIDIATATSASPENFTGVLLLNTTSELDVGVLPPVLVPHVFFGITSFFFVLGLCGNTCTIIIMKNSRDDENPHRVYLTSLAMADIMSLIVTTLTKKSTHAMFGMDIRALSVIGCKLCSYIFRCALTCSSFIIVLGPFVQSVVSLTSSLRIISLTVLADSIHNILIFFAEKM